MFQFMFNGEETKLNNQQQLHIQQEQRLKLKGKKPYRGFHFSYNYTNDDVNTLNRK